MSLVYAIPSGLSRHSQENCEKTAPSVVDLPKFIEEKVTGGAKPGLAMASATDGSSRATRPCRHFDPIRPWHIARECTEEAATLSCRVCYRALLAPQKIHLFLAKPNPVVQTAVHLIFISQNLSTGRVVREYLNEEAVTRIAQSRAEPRVNCLFADCRGISRCRREAKRGVF